MNLPGQLPSPQNASLAQALETLWLRYLPEFRERVAILESAAIAAASRSLTEEQRKAAHSAAHKSAGVLGTFGLARATELAREAEVLLSQQEIGSGASARLKTIAWDLEKMIRERSQQIS